MKVKDILSVIDKDNVVIYVKETKIQKFLDETEITHLTGFYR